MAVLRTVTLNTGYDDYYSVSGLDWGGVGAMHAYRSVCSGKGVSCARTAVALGLKTVAYALVGADDAVDYSARLAAEGIAHHLFEVPGSTRHNLTLIDAAGELVGAHFVGAGFTLRDTAPLEALTRSVLADVEAGDIVTLNGSTPLGLPADTWAGLARAVIERGARVIVDAQRDALVAALAVEGVLAFKPNDEEILALPQVSGAPDPVRTALDSFAAAGAELPLVSLGVDGVTFLINGTRFRGSCPVERPVQAVMAGDAFVAGLAWGASADDDPASWVRHGLAAAAAHVSGLSGQPLRAEATRRLGQVELVAS